MELGFCWFVFVYKVRFRASPFWTSLLTCLVSLRMDAVESFLSFAEREAGFFTASRPSIGFTHLATTTTPTALSSTYVKAFFFFYYFCCYLKASSPFSFLQSLTY